MNLAQRIELMAALGQAMEQKPTVLNKAIFRASLENQWFTAEAIQQSIAAIIQKYLQSEKLWQWVAKYPLAATVPNKEVVKTVGLVMAGNIPLVGFHDFLSVFLSGHQAMVKLSSKDAVLFKALAEMLYELNPNTQERLEIAERLQNFDAIIATGSNNSARYFETYFGKYPNIIRKSRSSVAVLTGQESKEEIKALGVDIFQYLGLGCRNVSKLMLPKNFDFVNFMDGLEGYNYMMNHNKFKNNYDYHRSIYLLNREHHYANNFLMLVQNESVASPISVVHYEFYADENDLANKLIEQKDHIQCVVGASTEEAQYIPFGQAQQPELWDYADKVDTMGFLCGL